MKKLLLLLVLSFVSTQGLSKSIKKILPNAYATECISSYYRNKTNTCSKLPENAYPYAYYASGPDFKCNSGYYRKNNLCYKLAPNTKPYSSSDGFYCSSGYKKVSGNCIKENHSNKSKEALELEIKIAEINRKAEEAKTLEVEILIKEAVIEDLLNSLRSHYVNNIAARVKSFWRYQGAENGWSAEVYVLQDRDGNVQAVDIQNINVNNSSLGKSFMDSIERAVYKSSPLPVAPDEAVFDSELNFIFHAH